MISIYIVESVLFILRYENISIKFVQFLPLFQQLMVDFFELQYARDCNYLNTIQHIVDWGLDFPDDFLENLQNTEIIICVYILSVTNN